MGKFGKIKLKMKTIRSLSLSSLAFVLSFRLCLRSEKNRRGNLRSEAREKGRQNKRRRGEEAKIRDSFANCNRLLTLAVLFIQPLESSFYIRLLRLITQEELIDYELDKTFSTATKTKEPNQ